MVLILFLLGAAFVVAPIAFHWTGWGLAIPMIFGGFCLALDAALTCYATMFKKPSANEAFVRTGLGGNRVILDSGAWVAPSLHRTVPVSLETMKLDIVREGHDALITKDNLRVDVKGEFYIRVQPNREDILNAARSLGGKSVNAEAVGSLVYEKLVSALRSVAATKELVEIHANREAFASAVHEMVRTDLQTHNGITLESVTISRLDQTDPKMLSDENIFDAQGKKKITEITQEAKVRTNELQQEAARAIEQKNVQTRQQILALEQQQAEVEATQARDVANVRAERKREQQVYQIEQDRIVQEAAIANEQMVKERQIAQEQAIQQASLQRDMAIIRQEQEKQQADIVRQQAVQETQIQQELAVQAAKIARDQAIVLREQEYQQTDILREQAIQAAELEKQRVLILKEQEKQQADIARQQAIEVAERERQIAVAQKEAQRAAAEAEALKAQAEREAAQQQVLTVQATAQAEREYQVKLTAAKQIIDQDKYKQQTEAEVQAFTRVKQAEAEQQAAEKQAQARLRLAQAEAEAKELVAKGDTAQKMVEVNVAREQVEVQRARVEVERQELENKQTFERAAIEFETAKLQIQANKEVQVAMAQSIGQFMSRGDYHIYGDPTTMSQMMMQVTRGLGFGALTSGLMEGMPAEAKDLLHSVTSRLGEVGSAVADRLAGQKAAASSDGGDSPTQPPEPEAAPDPPGKAEKA